MCGAGDPALGFGGFSVAQAATSRSENCLNQIKAEVDYVSRGVLQWNNPPYNFDDIFSAIQTMFYMATTEGWVDIMRAGQDVPSRPGLAPVQDVNWTYLLRPLYMEYLYVEFVCKCIYVYFTYILDGAGMVDRVSTPTHGIMMSPTRISWAPT